MPEIIWFGVTRILQKTKHSGLSKKSVVWFQGTRERGCNLKQIRDTSTNKNQKEKKNNERSSHKILILCTENESKTFLSTHEDDIDNQGNHGVQTGLNMQKTIVSSRVMNNQTVIM